MYVCKILRTILCNNLWYTFCKLYIAIADYDKNVLCNQIFVLYYIDQFHIHFNLVQVMDLWNVSYVRMYFLCDNLQPLKSENSASALHIIWFQIYVAACVQKFPLNSQYNWTNLYTAGPKTALGNLSAAHLGTRIQWISHVNIMLPSELKVFQVVSSLSVPSLKII